MLNSKQIENISEIVLLVFKLQHDLNASFKVLVPQSELSQTVILMDFCTVATKLWFSK